MSSVTEDVAAAWIAEPGDLAAIRELVLILDDLAETQRVTRMLQAEAQLALGRHLEAHPRAERAGLVPGWTLSVERSAPKRYDSAMVRARVAGHLSDDPRVTVDIDRDTGEMTPVPPSEVVRRTCAALWPLVGAHTDGYSGWRSQALDRIGVKAGRYVAEDDDAPPRGRATRATAGQTATSDPEETS